MDRNFYFSQAANLLAKPAPAFTKADASKAQTLISMASALPETAELQSVKRNSPILNPASEHDRLFIEYLKTGSRAIAEELRTVSYTPQTSVTDSSGGALVPKGFEVALENALRAYDPIFDAARLVETSNGSAFNYPVSCDEGYEAEIVAENGEGRNIPVVWNGISFAACPKWSSGFVLYPIELQQDSTFDLGAVLVDLFARRYAAGIGKNFVNVLLSEAASSLTTASAGAITPEELINLYASVNAAYLPSAAWVMKASTYAYILQLKNTNSRFYFDAEVDASGFPLLLGKRVYLSPSMPHLSADQKCIAFGDMNMFIRRQVRNSLVVHVMSEIYIEKAQIAVGSTWRMQGHLVTSSDPSDSSPAMRVLTQHS